MRRIVNPRGTPQNVLRKHDGLQCGRGELAAKDPKLMAGSYNRIVLVGNLTRDPEICYVHGGGKAVTKFAMAINRKTKNADETMFLDIVARDRLGNLQPVPQEGHVRTRRRPTRRPQIRRQRRQLADRRRGRR